MRTVSSHVCRWLSCWSVWGLGWAGWHLQRTFSEQGLQGSNLSALAVYCTVLMAAGCWADHTLADQVAGYSESGLAIAVLLCIASGSGPRTVVLGNTKVCLQHDGAIPGTGCGHTVYQSCVVLSRHAIHCRPWIFIVRYHTQRCARSRRAAPGHLDQGVLDAWRWRATSAATSRRTCGREQSRIVI
jgi:hypothetical protein